MFEEVSFKLIGEYTVEIEKGIVTCTNFKQYYRKGVIFELNTLKNFTRYQ